MPRDSAYTGKPKLVDESLKRELLGLAVGIFPIAPDAIAPFGIPSVANVPAKEDKLPVGVFFISTISGFDK